MIRKILGIFCILEILVGLYIIITQAKGSSQTIAIRVFSGTIVCLFLAFLAYHLLKKPKNSEQQTEVPPEAPPALEQPMKKSQNLTQQTFHLEVPQETIQQMQSVRSYIHSDELIRIIEDSYKICKDTTSLKTFESRLQLATQKAYTLKQMEIAGLYHANPTADYFLNLLVGNQSDLLNQFMQRSFESTLSKAKKELKTENGIQKRINKFIEELEDSALDFDISQIK